MAALVGLWGRATAVDAVPSQHCIELRLNIKHEQLKRRRLACACSSSNNGVADAIVARRGDNYGGVIPDDSCFVVRASEEIVEVQIAQIILAILGK